MEVTQMVSCASCAGLYESADGSDGSLCKHCRAWQHCFVLTEKEYYKTEDLSCLFCKKMTGSANREELTYDAGYEEDGSGESEPIQEDPDFPSGSPAKWTFHINMFTDSDQNIKLSDCIYFKESIGQKLMGARSSSMLRVQYLIKDINAVKWISGHKIIPPNEAISKKILKKRTADESSDFESAIYGQRLAVVGADIWIKVSSFEGPCSGLSLCDYEFGKPRFLKKDDVFSIGNTFEPAKNKISILTSLGFEPCKNPCLWEDYDKEEPTPVMVVDNCPPVVASPSILIKDSTNRSERQASFGGSRRISWQIPNTDQSDYLDPSTPKTIGKLAAKIKRRKFATD